MTANDAIKIFNPGTSQHDRLSKAAELIGKKTIFDANVADAYFDFGQKWTWTTILLRRPGSDSWFQALTPADQLAVLTAQNTEAAVDAIIESKRWERVTPNPTESKTAGFYEGEDKRGLVMDLNRTLSRIPAMRNWTLLYGAVVVWEPGRGEKFVELEENWSPSANTGRESVCLRHANGTEKIQSIHGDSLAAVFSDVGRLVADALY